MSDGMRRELVYLSSHATNRYFIPNWGQEDKVYDDAVNSYVGSGGGGLLTEGSGIGLKDLPLRIVSTTDKDLRYYIIDYFSNHPSPLRIPKISDWQFIPLPQVQKIVEKDKEILFR